MKRLMVIVVCAVALMTGCDRIDPSMIEKPDVQDIPDDTARAPAKVLLEYFTGHYCGNCPGSSAPAIAEILGLYGDRAVIMVIHAGPFAIPNLTPDKLNLTSTDGTKLYTDAGVTSVPVGRVNRRAYNGSILLAPSSWSSAAAQVSDDTARFGLAISSSYDSLTSTGIAQIKIKAYDDLAGSYAVSAFILEDSIIGYQLDFTKQPNEVPDYVFNHVLRDELAAAEGSALANGPITRGMEIVRNFSFALNAAWNAKQCWIAAAVIDGGSGETIQSERAKIIAP